MTDQLAGAVGGEAAIRRHFENQAKACDRLGSPFTARLCQALASGLDANTFTGRRVLGWQGDAAADALALRLCGGLHALVLAGADEGLAAVYPPQVAAEAALVNALNGAIRRNDEALSRWLDKPPQTNEIARSAMLLPGLLTIARETDLPLTLHEIGSSAGLNLLFDRFHYRYGGSVWGDQASPVRLAPEAHGSLPPLEGRLVVAGRHGSDIAPVDVGDPHERLRLASYVWADQKQRLERLDAAIQLAEKEPYGLEQADAEGFVERKLAKRDSDQTFVLMHSIMWQYMPAATQVRIEALMERAGRDASRAAPLAWLRMEPLSLRDQFATLSLTLWPAGETRHLAKCDYHGRWIEWL